MDADTLIRKYAAEAKKRAAITIETIPADKLYPKKAKFAEDTKTLTVAVDLDGTLAEYDGWKGEDVIGDPLPDMAEQYEPPTLEEGSILEL